MKKLLTLLCMLVLLSELNAKDITWSSPPDILSTSGVNASDGRIGVDLSGNAVAVWIENGNVKANTKPFGGSWGTATTISAGTGNASLPRLVVDGNGNATAIWLDGGIVKARTQPSGGSWGSTTSLSLTGSSAPQINVDAAGNLVAIWVNGLFIQSATKLFGGNWPVLPDTISVSLNQAAVPQVTIGSGGHVVAIWHDTTFTVFVASKSIAGSWGVPQTISTPAVNSVYPQIAVDGSGNATACWFRYIQTGSAYTTTVVQSATRPFGGAWTTPTDISNRAIDNPANLFIRVKADNQGNVVAAWTETDDGNSYNVFTAIKQLNQNWSTLAQVIGGSTTIAYLDLALTPFGNAFVLASYLNSSTANLDVQVADADIYKATDLNSWNGPETISLAAPNAFTRIAAVFNQTTNTFYTAAIWLNCTSSVKNIQSSTGSGPILLPPTSLTVTPSSTDYCVQTQTINTLNWTGSTSPDAANYVIVRNGVAIARIAVPTTTYVDINRVNGVDTYKVATEDSGFSQSLYATP